MYSFLFQGFAFNSVNEDVALQRLKCHVEICHIDNENSPCSTGCYEDEATTTTSTTTTSTTTTTAAEYNTHRFCEMRGWLHAWSPECLLAKKCYAYVHSDDYFYHDYNSYNEDWECQFTLSTECDPYFIDNVGDDCNYYDGRYCHRSNEFMLSYGTISPTGGVMTGLNCPQCGCGEDGPIRMEDRVDFP